MTNFETQSRIIKNKATPEVIEKTENLAKSKILEAYINKCQMTDRKLKST